MLNFGSTKGHISGHRSIHLDLQMKKHHFILCLFNKHTANTMFQDTVLRSLQLLNDLCLVTML